MKTVGKIPNSRQIEFRNQAGFRGVYETLTQNKVIEKGKKLSPGQKDAPKLPHPHQQPLGGGTTIYQSKIEGERH